MTKKKKKQKAEVSGLSLEELVYDYLYNKEQHANLLRKSIESSILAVFKQRGANFCYIGYDGKVHDHRMSCGEWCEFTHCIDDEEFKGLLDLVKKEEALHILRDKWNHTENKTKEAVDQILAEALKL
jgi:hypothetical protein